MTFNISELDRQWNRSSIEHWIGYAIRDISHLQKYIDAAQSRIAYLDTLTFNHGVECTRYKYNGGRVHYHVDVYQYPAEIENGKQHCRIYLGINHKFTGREKKKALECAKQLAEQYNCEVEGNVI